MGTIKDHITATMLANFVNKWLENATEVEATEGTRTADRFIDLRDSAVDIMERVAEVAEQYGFSDEQLQWEIQYDGGAVNISHLTSLHDWLVATGLMIGNIQMKPAVKKGAFPPAFSQIISIFFISWTECAYSENHRRR